MQSPKYNRPSIRYRRKHTHIWYNYSLCLCAGWHGDMALTVCNLCLFKTRDWMWNTQISILIHQWISIANKNKLRNFSSRSNASKSRGANIRMANNTILLDEWAFVFRYFFTSKVNVKPFWFFQVYSNFFIFELRKFTSTAIKFHFLGMPVVIDLLRLPSLPLCSLRWPNRI